MTSHSKGLLLGLGAILFWSTSAMATVWAKRAMGAWQFLAISCLVSGVGQVLYYRRRNYAWGRLLLPPPHLWAAIAGCLVVYLITITLALVRARGSTQEIGVSLVNYLWPTLTILFAWLLVPGTRLRLRLLGAAVVALGGLALANWKELRGAAGQEFLPYGLALISATCWGLYSALLSRWRSAATNHPTAPLGFLLAGLIAAVICSAQGDWRAMAPLTLVAVLYAGVGPQGAGYMLWEMALHRAPAGELGLLGSATPVLSTAWLLALYQISPVPGQSRPEVAMLLMSAVLISAAVVIGRSNGKAA